MSAATEGTGAHRGEPLLGLSTLELLALGGPDRERLLHGLVTGEVRSLVPGATTHGFFTHAKGGILADYRLLVEEGRFLLLLPAGTAAAIAAHLEKYHLAADVSIRPLSGSPVLESFAVGVEELASADAVAGGLSWIRDPAAKASRLLIWPRSADPPADAEAWLRAASQTLRLRLVSAEEIELARIEAGELRFGVDFGPENFPQETGRDGAVSYTKGCFLGQEVVARIHYRGGVQKRPCGLRFDAAEPPPAGVELRLEGRAVGRATSVALSPAHGAIGLGILHQRGAEIGTRLEVEGESRGLATVVALPFESGR